MAQGFKAGAIHIDTDQMDFPTIAPKGTIKECRQAEKRRIAPDKAELQQWNLHKFQKLGQKLDI